MIAPGRARRPGAFVGAIEEPTAKELADCPFCEGREERTPPHTLLLPAERPWTVRVVPNLYPALERQEVVIHSPRHVRSFAELEDGELALVAEAWRLRSKAAHADGFAYVHAMVNEGRFAGASLAHSHSQLVWLRQPPPAVEAEADGACGVCRLLEPEALRVSERGELVTQCHRAGRVPYELLIAPRSHGSDPFGGGLDHALQLLRDSVRRLRAIEGPAPWNAWLHGGSHWHLEVVPRLTVFAGLELGAEIYINVVAPDDAAESLRTVD